MLNRLSDSREQWIGFPNPDHSDPDLILLATVHLEMLIELKFGNGPIFFMAIPSTQGHFLLSTGK